MKPVGVITLTDILKCVCAAAEEPGGEPVPNAEDAAAAAEAVEDELAEVLGMLDVGPMLAA
jgi:hypothetical protein